MNTNFWKDIPTHKSFQAAFDRAVYTPFDPTWHLLIADIQGSTQAIQNGHYKDVNMVGAMSIVSVLNACADIEIPFIFGGDGATLLVPASHLEKAKHALLDTQQKSARDFALHLRVGSISVQTLKDKGIDLLVAKHEISDNYKQAIFFGSGMSQADNLLKSDTAYCHKAMDDIPQADFSGLECRWQDIPSPKDETLSLIVSANDAEEYQDLLQHMAVNIGGYRQRSPVQEGNLNLSLSFSQLAHEAKAKSIGMSHYPLTLKLWLLNILGIALVKLNAKLQDSSWGKYKAQIIQTTDAEKFDGMLRMTFSADTANRIKLEAYLEDKHQQGRLCYGIHITNRALMTCLVFERMGSQVHFVDAADGGYAIAATKLKKQLQAR